MGKDFKFDPWEQAELKTKEGCLDIEISEPPCKYCHHWKPRITTDQYGNFDGINLCSRNEMHSDFSCFKKAGV